MMKDQKGVTLVELLVTLAITSIVLVSLFQIIRFSMNGYRRQTSTVNLQMDARTFLSGLSSDVRRSDRVYITGDTLFVERGGQGHAYELEGHQVKRNGSVVLENVTMFQKTIAHGVLEVTIETMDNVQSNALSIKLSLGEREVFEE